jgi:hypothetical protein
MALLELDGDQFVEFTRQLGVEQRPQREDEQMSTRRMAYWWFRFVVSGRFLEEFFNLRRR